MDASYVPVAVVTSRTEAELIAGMLRSNGLRADVSADDAGGQDPQLQILGVRVLVAAADEAPARRLIAEADADLRSTKDQNVPCVTPEGFFAAWARTRRRVPERAAQSGP
jgi:Putative prokaryotic signal transducing protein